MGRKKVAGRTLTIGGKLEVALTEALLRVVTVLLIVRRVSPSFRG